MDEINIWRTAIQMIRIYGTAAFRRASAQSDRMAKLNDNEGTRVWSSVCGAIQILHERIPELKPRKTRSAKTAS